MRQRISDIYTTAQLDSGIPGGIGRDKDELDLTSYIRGQFLQRRAKIRR